MYSDRRYSPLPCLQNFGSWNLRDIKFLQGTSIPSWAVVSFADKRWEKEGLGPFIPEFVRGLRNVSVQIADRPPVIQARPSDPVDKVLSHAAQQAMKAFKTKPRIILVVLPDTGAALYKEVKQTSDSLLGIPSQCIVARKAGIGDRNPRGQLQYIANVALKMNAKVGGVNVGLSPNVVARLPPFLKDFRSKPFMLMGADVTHPLPGSQAPSLAAVVASLDGSCGKYAARVSAQPTAPGGKQIEEIIQDLRGMVREMPVFIA